MAIKHLEYCSTKKIPCLCAVPAKPAKIDREKLKEILLDILYSIDDKEYLKSVARRIKEL